MAQMKILINSQISMKVLAQLIAELKQFEGFNVDRMTLDYDETDKDLHRTIQQVLDKYQRELSNR